MWIYDTIGEEVVALLTRLREMRKRRNLSQKVLSKELNIDQSTYSGYETGKSGIPLRTVKRLMNNLKKDGKIRRRGSNRNGSWIIVDPKE